MEPPAGRLGRGLVTFRFKAPSGGNLAKTTVRDTGGVGEVSVEASLHIDSCYR